MIPIFAFRKSNSKKSQSLESFTNSANSSSRENASSQPAHPVNSNSLPSSSSLSSTFPFKAAAKSIDDDQFTEGTTSDTKISEDWSNDQETLSPPPICLVSHRLKNMNLKDDFCEISMESNNEYQNKRPRRMYGFHQNPHQRWQHYCDTGSGELLTLLQRQQVPKPPITDSSPSNNSNNISRSRSTSINTMQTSAKSDASTICQDHDEAENTENSPRRSLPYLSFTSLSIKKLKYSDSSSNSEDDEYDSIFFCEEGISRIPFSSTIPIYPASYPLSITGENTATGSRKFIREFRAMSKHKRTASAAFHVSDTPLNSPTIENSPRTVSNTTASSSFPTLMSRIKSLSTLFTPAAITSSHS